jgi:tetratricopeptide (TPR) repeat protein
VLSTFTGASTGKSFDFCLVSCMLCSFSVLFVAVASLCHGFDGCPVSALEKKEPSGLLKESIRLLDEQRHAEAQECFLLAIAQLPGRSDCTDNSAEREAFDSFLLEYEESFQSLDSTSALLDRVHTMLSEHPHYYSLLYYVAACQANLGHLREFFDAFFQAVSARPSCFMASKVIGVLHLRLYESSSDEAVRLRHRKEAITALRDAFKKEPRDISLLMKLAFILPENEKRELVCEVCKDVLRHDKSMKRGDCLYIIRLAMALSLNEEAKLLVDKARTWYEYSRTLNVIADELEGASPPKNP